MFHNKELLFIPLVFLFLSLLGAGCIDHAGSRTKTGTFHTVRIRYAQGFRVDTASGRICVEVLKPWQGKEISHYIYIIGTMSSGDKKQSGVLFIGKKINRIICTSTTHIAFLDQLGVLDKVVAVSGKKLINNKYILKKLAGGQIADIGYDKNMDYETIVRLQPDVVFLYGIGPEVTSTITRLASLHIPAVIIGDYLERSPLGRAEWIKFFGAFLGKESRAVAWFDSLALQYEKARFTEKTTIDSLPVVMTGLPWNETWYVSGQSSMLATFIHDAGGQYVWEDKAGGDATPMDIEQVYRKAGHADIWINCGTAASIQDILDTDKRLGLFKPVKTGRVYNNNARLNAFGGNDYWESGVIHPDIIIRDLRHIFHPDHMPDYQFYYYRHLK